MSGVKAEEKLEVPMHLVLDGVSCQLIASEKVAEGQPCLAFEVHDLKAARRSLDLLLSDVICAVGAAEEEKLTKEAQMAL